MRLLDENIRMEDAYVRSDNVFNDIEDRRVPYYFVYPGEKQMRFGPDRRPRRMFHDGHTGVAFKLFQTPAIAHDFFLT